MQEKILDLDLSILSHLLYSLDFAPSDFGFIHSLQNSLNDKKIFQEVQVKMSVEKFVSSKPYEFYLRGINKLTDKWQKVIQNINKYTIDWN